VTSVIELERAGSTSALELCTGDAAAFSQRTWGRSVLVHRGAEPEAFAELLSLDDVDHILSTTSLRTPSFRLVKAGEQIPESSYTRSGTTGSKPVSGMADPTRVFELFGKGATIVLQGVHRYWEPVSVFTRDLELELGSACQVNAYVTPPGAQGLELHEDPHDVFVLQAFGRKAWEVHAAPGEPARDPVRATIEPGDCIYMPKGTPHAASAQETVSGHLTVGVHVATWRDVIGKVWRVVERDIAFDDPLPLGWHRHPEVLERVMEKMLAVARGELGRLSPRELADAYATDFLSTRATLLRGGLTDVLGLGQIGDDTVVERRRGSVCELRTRGDRLDVLLGDRRLEMPSWLEPAMRRIATAERFRVRDLADAVNDPDSRAVLVRRLVREGLLTIAR
jgi:bifunctional lysine-specific demethylase and histidyl-hydroxylase NO66